MALFFKVLVLPKFTLYFSLPLIRSVSCGTVVSGNILLLWSFKHFKLNDKHLKTFYLIKLEALVIEEQNDMIHSFLR